MLEDARAEHRVDTVAGVQHEILPDPTMAALKSIATASARPITISVLAVWWTTTLSITT